MRQVLRSFSHRFIAQVFRIYEGKEKTTSEIGTDYRTKAVLEVLSDNPQLTGEDIANQCHFESRTSAAGTIAKLVRVKSIEQIPASYRITDSGRSALLVSTNGAEEEQPKKTKRKSRKEPQEEPSSGQGEQPSP